MKRVISFALALLLMMPMFAISASAAAPHGIYGNGTNGISLNINAAPYTTYANKSYGQYAYGTMGCAWFASARANQLTGINTVIWSGYKWYYEAYSYYGYTRGRTLKAKALACYDNHVAVVERVNGNQVTISEGGCNGFKNLSGVWEYPNANHGYCAIHITTQAEVEAYTSARGNFLGYVYIVDDVKWYDNQTPVNLGNDFYAKLAKTQGGMPVGVNGTNVQLVANANDATQVWRFLRQNDGSYILQNKQLGTAMDVAGGVPASGTNVQVYEKFGEDNAAQKWFVYGTQGAYILRPKLTDCVLDVYDNSSAVGTNVHIWTKNNSAAQNFSIIKIMDGSNNATMPSEPVNPDTMASVVVDTSMSQYSVGSTNAVLSGVVNNPSNRTISTVGLYLYDCDGNQIGKHAEQCNPSYVTHNALKMWFDLNNEAGIALKPGVRYQYALYAYVDGKLYVSNMAYFQTTGYTLGDVDASGSVTAADALLALQGATKKVSLTTTQSSAASVDAATGASANDALLILQYATKKISVFPIAG